MFQKCHPRGCSPPHDANNIILPVRVSTVFFKKVKNFFERNRRGEATQHSSDFASRSGLRPVHSSSLGSRLSGRSPRRLSRGSVSPERSELRSRRYAGCALAAWVKTFGAKPASTIKGKRIPRAKRAAKQALCGVRPQRGSGALAAWFKTNHPFRDVLAAFGVWGRAPALKPSVPLCAHFAANPLLFSHRKAQGGHKELFRGLGQSPSHKHPLCLCASVLKPTQSNYLIYVKRLKSAKPKP